MPLSPDSKNNRQTFAVTTSHRVKPELVENAQRMAVEFGVPYVDRDDHSIEFLTRRLLVEGMIVVSSQRVFYMTGGQEFFFHPGLARLRIKELKYGKTDQMIRAMDLRAGESILDCTLGLGTDAIVASFVCGTKGRVVGLESSRVISELVRRGLSSYPETDQDIALAMQRIKVVNVNHKEYLTSLPRGSYHVVYFDPMFRFPRHQSTAINSMRSLVNPDPLDHETIKLAVQVASKRVVVKERRGSAEFERLGFHTIRGGKYAPVAFGVIESQGYGI